MALQYKPTKHAKVFDPDSLTEQEHKDSCDINKMLRDARRGLQIRGSAHAPQYGYDDTTMTALDFRIQKSNLESELSESARTTELTKEQIAALPPDVRKKFGFKEKKAQKPDPAKNNDDKTTMKNADNEPPKQNSEPKPNSSKDSPS